MFGALPTTVRSRPGATQFSAPSSSPAAEDAIDQFTDLDSASPTADRVTSVPERADRPATGRDLAARWPRWLRGGLAWGRKAWWIEIVTIVVGYGLYEIVQGAAPAHRSAAFANAGNLIDLEQWMHLNPELAVNHFVNANVALATLCGYYYDSLHYLITPAVLLWLWWRRPEVYGRWRSALVGASVASLVVFWAWPLAPPRLAQNGIIDTLVTQHIMGSVETHSASTLVNDYAAMPSLHVGWALWCAATLFATTSGRWRGLVWLYPVATTLVVLGTGNHYLFDAVGGAAVLAIGMAVTADRRPRRSDVESHSRLEPASVSARP